jgi:RNA methyltransferase, TrmH family
MVVNLMITEISSLQHPLVKKWVRLRSEKEAREEEGLVLLVGEKMIRDLSKQIEFQALISVRPASEIGALERYIVKEEILRKITGVASPDGFAAVAKLPEPVSLHSLARKKRVLILDRLADPGNLGTILRTALALGWDGVLLTPGTVDPFNDKALRASKGALFSMPYVWADGALFLQQSQLPAYLADLEGTALSDAKVADAFALILSNEGQGPSGWAERDAQKISIPMRREVESLNVAASGAIFLYVMRPKVSLQ